MIPDDLCKRPGPKTVFVRQRLRRRWWQYSLSTVLAVMVIVCSASAIFVTFYDAYEEMEAQRRIRELKSQLQRAEAELKRTNDRLTESQERHEQALQVLYRKIQTMRADPLQLFRADERAALRQALAEYYQRLHELANKDAAFLEAIRKRFGYRLERTLTVGGSGELEEVVDAISGAFDVRIEIQIPDLREAQIPRIRYVNIGAKRETVEQTLARVVLDASNRRVRSLRDPDLQLVYVLSLGRQGDPRIILTTRKHATERGVLPEAFRLEGGQAR